MAEDYLQILSSGVQQWNTWRRENPDLRPDLSFADLTRLRLPGVNFAGAILRGTRFRGSILTLANFVGADLERSNFLGAIVSGANLKNANLTNANLMETNFNQSTLRGAHLSGCLLYETNFANVDLTDAQGLESCRHLRPSTIEHRTLARSGPIPIEFLRGCGVPEFIIDNITMLKRDPLQFYSCFISYSSTDTPFVEQLHRNLQGSGVRCWFAPKDLKIGDRIRTAIDDAIHHHDKLLVVLSETSVRSHWVEQEIEKAFERERSEDRLILFPIRIDDTVFSIPDGWANHLKNTRNIGDFRQWENEQLYSTAFRRLMRDLAASGGA